MKFLKSEKKKEVRMNKEKILVNKDIICFGKDNREGRGKYLEQENVQAKKGSEIREEKEAKFCSEIKRDDRKTYCYLEDWTPLEDRVK